MKILIVNVAADPGSTGRLCTDLAEQLESGGHQVCIAYGRKIVLEKYKKFTYRIGNDIDVKLHVLISRLFDRSGFGSKSVTRRFVNWIKEFDPDVIHVHNVHGYYMNIEIFFEYLRECGKRIIWTMHDCWAFTGHSALCDGDSCTKWETGCGKCPQRGVYPASIVDRSRTNWVKKKDIFTGIPNMKLTAPSCWLKNNIKRSFLNEYTVEVINNGIDVTLFRPVESKFSRKYKIVDKFIVLGVAGSWKYKKGFEDFCYISTQLDEKFQIVLVGVDKKRKKKLPKNIIGIEKTDTLYELVEIYSASDVFLNLTYCDSYPTVNLEARACGLKIITYDTGGSKEAAGEDAFAVVEKGDMDGIISSLIEMEKEFGKSHHDRCNELKKINNKDTIKRYINILLNNSGL